MWENNDWDRLFLASMVLEGRIESPVVEEWNRRVKPRGNWSYKDKHLSLQEKGFLIGECLGPINHERHLLDLFPDWFFDELHVPLENANIRDSFIDKFLGIMQTRPPVWIRFQEKDTEKVLKQLQGAFCQN